MLELLFGILLRNRDRIAALWPPVYEHLHVSGAGGEHVGRGRTRRVSVHTTPPPCGPLTARS